MSADATRTSVVSNTLEARSEQGSAPPVRRSLIDRLYRLRDRLIADPARMRWASRFPLTRRLARSRERALFDITSGFVYTQVLTACVQLRLFGILRDDPISAEALADRIGLPLDGTQRLIAAAVSIGLLERRSGDRVGLGELGVAVAALPALEAVVAHNAMFYADLADPVRLLRGDHSGARLSRFWAYANSAAPEALDSETVSAYSAFMAATQTMIAEDVLDAYPIGRHRSLLDVGGGEGVFATAAARRAPGLSVTLFDLPAVAERAQRQFATAGLAGRARAVGGSFHVDALPRGADVVSLVRVLFDHDDPSALAILKGVRDALPQGGRLLVAETLGGGREGDAYFGFYLLAMGQGRPRTFSDLARLLAVAGFDRIEQRTTFRRSITSVITARAS